jgi:hypothetical protein
MPHPSVPARLSATITPAALPLRKLEPDAISVTQDVVIGMASSAPAASTGLTLAALTAATAYGNGTVIFLTAVPMLVIANAYRRLNLWNANCGASFEWVGRAINPYLGFLAGWLMIAAYVIATVSGVEVPGPSVLAVFGASPASTWADIAIGTAVGVVMLVIAIAGIKITARTQVGMAFVEYALLIGFGLAGLIAVLAHSHGDRPVQPGMAEHQRRRRGGQRRIRVPRRGVHVHRLGRHPVRQRGSNEPLPQPRPRGHHRGCRARRHLHAVHGRNAGLGAGVRPAEKLGLGARLHRPGHRRQRLGEGDGVRAGPVGHRHHRHRHRPQRPHHLRDGQPPGAAGLPWATCQPGSPPRPPRAPWPDS